MEDTQFALHKAIFENDDDQARKYILQEANVDEISAEGWSPLHLCAQMSNFNVAKWLVNAGAKINIKNANGVTPLHSCCWSNANAIAELLMKNGANVNAKDNLQWTPLMLAAWSNHDDLIDLLVKNGASINARNRNDSTALHLAAYNNCPLALNRLLEHKANVNMQNKDGMAPIDIAIKRKNQECEEILRSVKSRRRASSGSVATPISVNQRNYIDSSVDVAEKPDTVEQTQAGQAGQGSKTGQTAQKVPVVGSAAATAAPAQRPASHIQNEDAYYRDVYFLLDKPEQDMPFLTELTKEKAKLSSDGNQEAPLFPEQLINITLAGDKVRRKSEVVIANLLYSLDLNYVYERKLCGTVAVGINYPAFTIFTPSDSIIIWEHVSALETTEKKQQFNLLKRWYKQNGFVESRNFFVSKDTPQGGIDSNSIWEVAEKINNLVESAVEDEAVAEPVAQKA